VGAVTAIKSSYAHRQRVRVDDVVNGWETWLLALGAGHSLTGGKLLSGEDLDARRPPGDRPDESLADEDLALRFRRGDDQAFALLYARYRAPLLRFVRRTTPDPSDLEELVQEIWMAVIRGRERYIARARFVTYLFSIARRRSADRWRRHGVQPDPGVTVNELEGLPAPVQMWPEPRAQTEALGAAIIGAIDALPLAQREVFLLRAETDLTLDEIAQVTGTTRETAKSRLRYALSRLRTILEPWHER
jgi:RNA polymerase sigma-70 factor, ECF subfamily